MKISVFGLGKLGTPMLAVFASKGFEVIGFDVSSDTIADINRGISSVDETGLQELLDKNRTKFKATDSVDTAVINSDVSFIIVPTPSQLDGKFSNEYVLDCVEKIGTALNKKDEYHLVVITSTVMPGTTTKILAPALEKMSGRKLGESLGLCYNPEFIALGTVIRDMLHPDILLIGESDSKAGDLLETIYKRSVDTAPIVHRMNFQEAEISKIAVNTFVTTKISYANMLSELCDKVGAADVDKVTNAIGDDSRIGGKYLKGGAAYGGPCFPRDNRAFSALGEELGVNTALADSTDLINNYQEKRLLKIVTEEVLISEKISVLGCSYKPKTPIHEDSPGLALMDSLATMNYRGFYSDPCCEPSGNAAFEYNGDLDFIVQHSKCIIIMTTHDIYKNLPSILSNLGVSQLLIVDPWRMFEPNEMQRQKYIALGAPGYLAS